MRNTPTNPQPGGHWSPKARAVIDEILETHGNRGESVILDFDNTVFCGDIGESILPVAVQRGKLDARVIETYQRKLSQTAHAKGDHSPFADAYAYATEVFEGLTPAELVELTDGAVDAGKRALPGGALFYPRVVELIASLKKGGLSVKVVSASNVWSVRRMVTGYLNPILEKEHGASGIQVEDIVGISVLMRDKRSDKLFTHTQLGKTDTAYNRMEADAYERYSLTGRIAHPLPAYAGKVANIIQHFGEKRPVLALGDSPNDIPMLKYARNRIWIARLSKRAYIEELVGTADKDAGRKWIVQPATTVQSCRFVSPGSRKRLEESSLTEDEKGSWELLKNAGML